MITSISDPPSPPPSPLTYPHTHTHTHTHTPSKVTIPAELAVQVVSATGDLAKVKVRSHVERLHDLLGRCQRTVFMDMLPYWGRFCLQYIAPDGSTVSLPPGKRNVNL